jgi:hypothetical protein
MKLKRKVASFLLVFALAVSSLSTAVLSFESTLLSAIGVPLNQPRRMPYILHKIVTRFLCKFHKSEKVCKILLTNSDYCDSI